MSRSRSPPPEEYSRPGSGRSPRTPEREREEKYETRSRSASGGRSRSRSGGRRTPEDSPRLYSYYKYIFYEPKVKLIYLKDEIQISEREIRKLREI